MNISYIISMDIWEKVRLDIPMKYISGNILTMYYLAYYAVQ